MAQEPETEPTRGIAGGQYRPLRADRLGRIHETALRVLEEVGIRVECEEARQLLTDGGARSDEQTGRLRLRPVLVERALRQAPSRIVLCSRDAKRDLVAEGRRTWFGTGGAAVHVVDLETRERRSARLADIAELARIADALPNIDFFVRPCAAQDVPADELAVNELYACLANTERHVMGAVYNPEGARKVLEMASLIAGSTRELLARPFLTVIVSWMDSPLSFDTIGTQTLIESVRTGLPVALSSAPMAGSTSPITLAGTLVQLHAEELAGIVLVQLVRPGAPLLYGGVPSMADMRRLSYIGGGVEFGLMNAAIAQLSHYVGVPNYNSAGVTEAKIPDIQAVYEKCFAVLQCALSGSNCIHHAAGMLESLLTVSHEQLVIDNEIIGMAARAVRGIEVDEDRLAFDAIREAALEGNYLTSDHTMAHLRSEFFEPMLADRNDREKWEELGAQDIRDKARDKARDLLASAPACRLPEGVDRAIRERFPIRLPH
jgi:trimethylamine--corrinoid protein Co-methyltransferase